MGGVCFAAWAAGFAAITASHADRWEEYWLAVGTALLLCPLLSLAAQAPFWLMRLAFTWRIVHRSDKRRERPLAIRDIMFIAKVVPSAHI